MSVMIINASLPSELRVAISQDRSVIDYFDESDTLSTSKGDVYYGTVTSVESSLDACFVRYSQDGDVRQGFLPFKEIAPHYLGESGDKAQLKTGQRLLVQIEKDERGTKGAALTTYISLAGTYLVLMPYNPSGGGVSRRISHAERDEAKALLAQLELPEDYGLIVRTAGMGRSYEELSWDLHALLAHWNAIESALEAVQPPCLIHRESSGLIKMVRDYLRPDIEQIIVDDPDAYDELSRYIAASHPSFSDKCMLHTNRVPVFTHYQVEQALKTIHTREVTLPSGGVVVFDVTEALVSIDVNSAKATRGKDIEQTALETNLEAARAIAVQLRLRNLAGLIVIDFIDMSDKANRKNVQDCLADALKPDRARIQLADEISRFGLMEMSRQRLKTALNEQHTHVCSHCHGSGQVRTVESLSSHILHALEENAIFEQTPIIHIQLPVDVATYMVNERRKQLSMIESRYGVSIVVIPNPNYHRPRYQLKRVRATQAEPKPSSNRTPSHVLGQRANTDEAPYTPTQSTSRQETPAVPSLHHFQKQQRPQRQRRTNVLMALLRAVGAFFGIGHQSTQPSNKKSSQRGRHQHTNASSSQRQGGRSRRRRSSRRGGNNQRSNAS